MLTASCAGAPTSSERTGTNVSALTNPTGKTVVGYLPAYMMNQTGYTEGDIDFSTIAYINHYGTTISSTGTLVAPSTSPRTVPDSALVTEAHNNGSGILLVVGGAGGDSNNFSAVMNNSTYRSTLTTAIVNFVVNNNYDGVDIDWEYPSYCPNTTSFPTNCQDRNNFTTFLSGLRTALNTAKAGCSWPSSPSTCYVLSIAAPATDFYGQYFDVANIKGHLNWIAAMTYDIHGEWDTHTGHNSPLWSSSAGTGDAQASLHGTAAASVNSAKNYYLTTRGLSYTQFLIGIPLYGRYLNGTSDVYQLATLTGGAMPYRNIVPRIDANSWTKYFDSASSVPYLRKTASPVGFTSYDDVESIGYKCSFQKNAGNYATGSIIWALSQDWGENRLYNETFTNDILGWSSVNSAALSRDTGHTPNSGTNEASIHINPTGTPAGNAGAIAFAANVPANTHVTFELDLLVWGGNPPSTPGHSYTIGWDENDSSGNYLRSRTLSDVGTGHWVHKTVSGLTGATTASLNVYLLTAVKSGSNSGDFWIDNVRVYRSHANSLVSNSHFETNTTGWSGLNSATLASETGAGNFHWGVTALKATTTGTNPSGPMTNVTGVSASTPYTASIWFRGTSGVSYTLAWDENNSGGSYLNTKSRTFTGTTDWQRVAMTRTTASTATNVNLYVYRTTASAGSVFYLDDVTFTSVANTQPLVNAARACR
jgi:chitinase